MVGSGRKSVQVGVSRALVAMLAGALALSSAGCFLPILTAIPSVINLAHGAYTGNNATDVADADPTQNPDVSPAGKLALQQRAAEQQSEKNQPTQPAPQLTEANLCQMMAIAHPNMVLVELRKNAGGAPEYRELRLVNSATEAHWTPVVDASTGAGGWVPAVNFLKMDFQPALSDVIPSTGTAYLAYAPSPVDPNDPNEAEILKTRFGGQVGTFYWGGQKYLFSVGHALPCLSPSTESSATVATSH